MKLRWQVNLFLRKVTHHPQARDNYRVIFKEDGAEIEIGSIGVQLGSGTAEGWAWAIDTAIPMREVEAEGVGKDRADCMRQFRAAWEKFSADRGRLTEFRNAKRKRQR